MSHRYVVIGANIAGTTCAEALRKELPDASVTVIDRDTHPLYSRVLLPHYVKNKIEREKLFLRQESWAQEQGIEWMRGVSVDAIDTGNRFVATSEGREIPYDTLIVATGGDVNVAPFAQREVSYLQSLEDAEQLKTLIAEILARPEDERAMLVYGGGFIAIEYINICAHFGIRPIVVMRSAGFWSRALPTRGSEILVAHAKQQGVELHLKTDIRLVQGDQHVEGVLLENGHELAVPVVGVGIGAHAELELFKDAGIDVASGVVTDGLFQTSDKNVYAIGDVAEFDDQIVGRKMKYGNWMNAQMQGRIVAKTLSGTPTPFELVSSYSTNLLGKEIVFIGDTAMHEADDVREAESDEGYVAVFDRGGRTVGAVLIGSTQKRAMITKAIKEQQRYEITT